MRILLDTHIFLWYISADRRLPLTYQTAIQDPANDVFLSVASVWEAVIKHQMGKLPLPAPPAHYLPLQRIAHSIHSLPVDEAGMTALANLPSLHRDPFDRLIIAQATWHGLTIASVDPQVIAYSVPVLPTA